MNLSQQQIDVINWVRDGRGSSFVEAVAGSGKTTTLIEAISETKGSVAFAAYNKRIADEIAAKVGQRMPGQNRVRVGTFHSFGYGAWRRANPAVQLDARKKEDRTRAKLELPRQLYSFVPKLVGLAKQRAIGLFGAVEDRSLWFDIIDHFDLVNEIEGDVDLDRAVELAQKALNFHKSIAHELIDFDDMIYMPVVTDMRLWQNDFCFVDEAQDTNPARRALVRKMLRAGGRALFVGDTHQAIYAFQGADADAIDQIKKDFNCISLPLTVSWRCPKAVVCEAQKIVSHIQAADTAPEGHVAHFNDKQWLQMTAPGGETTINDRVYKPLTAADAILCRLTKPLVKTAYQLIRKGIACHVEGKEIGVGLVKLVNKFAARDLDQLREQLEKHMEDQTARLIAKGKETQAEALQDRIETIFVIADECKSLDELRAKVVSMFLDAESEAVPTLTLASYHRSKGREWARVWLVGHHDYIPSKWARQEYQIVQEFNTAYVGITRAKAELIFVPAPL